MFGILFNHERVKGIFALFLFVFLSSCNSQKERCIQDPSPLRINADVTIHSSPPRIHHPALPGAAPYAKFVGKLVNDGLMTQADALDLLRQYDIFYINYANFESDHHNEWVLVVNDTVIVGDTEEEVLKEAETRFPGRQLFYGFFPIENF